MENIAGYSNEEWIKLKKEFQRDYENSTKYNRSFREIITDILAGENEYSFELKTGLNSAMLYRLRNNVDEKDPIARKTLFSVSVGYNLDLILTLSLMDSLGMSINRFNKRDYAYAFLLTKCRGKNVDDCNEILKELGIEEKYFLGSYARNDICKK